MHNEAGSLSTSARLRAWADTLPVLAAQVVARSDLTRPYVHVGAAAVPAQLGLVRRRINGWADQVGMSEVERQDVALAVDEAVSNAVEHAYPNAPGDVVVFAGCMDVPDTVRVIVADRGVWRQPPADPGFRGRGLSLMERLAPVFRLVHGPRGTTVVLGWP
jgi:serine/threonine-protein kinase RsbW